jgi:solute carrier family 13 (sodium-dependent dicarboxylate transporter), member 2/3/5
MGNICNFAGKSYTTFTLMPIRKKSSLPDPKKIAGIILGIIGFCLPLVFHFDGLSFAGHLALGIFLLSAVFWMFETIPIYSTSLLVIFLQIVLLSQQGPLYKEATLPVVAVEAHGEDAWRVPAGAVDGNLIYVAGSGQQYSQLKVDVMESAGGGAVVSAPEITEETKVVSDSRNKLIGYRPVGFSVFFNTLANSIIILFLGGFVLASAAVKYNLDKNLTNILLKPFGEKPVFIVLGLMLVTATLSAFMSNTATTAMMMTVAIPIAAQIAREDKFRIMIALAIPIAANIGGMTTPIGTPPNAIVIANLQQQGISLTFGTWVGMMLPLVIALLMLAWLAMQILFPPIIKQFKLSLQSKFDKSPRAIFLYVIFAVTVLLWFTEANHGIPSAMIAFIPIVALTVTSVLGKEEIRSLPWEVLWLVAGGISLGISMENTGLANWLVSSISWNMLPQLVLLLVFGLVALMLSNFLSNTVTATILVPLAVSLGTAGIAGEGFSLLITSLVIGAGANMAMLLPISTPPNAIAMSTGFIHTRDMVKIGFIIGIIGTVLALVLAKFYWPLIIQ